MHVYGFNLDLVKIKIHLFLVLKSYSSSLIFDNVK